MTDRPELRIDDYLDALALCRATLRNDESGLMAIVINCDPAMMTQALVMLHLAALDQFAGGDLRAVDGFLAHASSVLGAGEPPC